MTICYLMRLKEERPGHFAVYILALPRWNVISMMFGGMSTGRGKGRLGRISITAPHGHDNVCNTPIRYPCIRFLPYVAELISACHPVFAVMRGKLGTSVRYDGEAMA